MPGDSTIIAGIKVPSTSPFFLAIVGVHFLLGIACVISGADAMLSPKRRGRHPMFGRIYFWCLSALFASATGLSLVRWAEDYHLFFLGAFSFGCAVIGRSARRHQWPKWARFHISGMGASYIVLLSAFYVDNGKNLPIWRDLPTFTYWLLPVAIGIPIIVHALLRHPVVRRTHDLEEGAL